MAAADEFIFDKTDLAIVRMLKENGRATNREIAEELGLTAITVASRIRQMEEARQLSVIAVSDFAAHGYDVLVPLTIELDNRHVSEAAEQIAEFEEVFAAHVVTGSYDIDLLVAVPDFDGLRQFMLGKLSNVEGVRSMTPYIAVDIVKYKFGESIVGPY